MELFLTPVGKNKLGTFLARSDKWYRRHIYDSFKGPLGICPQVSILLSLLLLPLLSILLTLTLPTQ